jgi:hypothetical protein
MMETADFIKEIYSEHPKPLYLSKLGSILKNNNYKVHKLRELVESIDGFAVVCGPEKERTAIASTEDKLEVQELLNKSAKKLEPEILQFLSSCPRTVLYAFASKQKASPNVYIMNAPPYRFGFAKENDSMIEIQNELLLDARIPFDLKKLEHDIANKLYRNIKKWTNDNDIDFTAYVKYRTQMGTNDGITLLEEMYNAIPANKRSKIVLPLDVIGYLMKKR